MKLVGDPKAIEALKEIAARDKGVIKFLLGEAQSSVDHTAAFQGTDGSKFVLRLDPATGELDCQPARDTTGP